MDLWFWTVVAIAVVLLLTTWFMWGKAYSLQVDLDIAGDELREAHASLDRLAHHAAAVEIERDAARLLAKVRLGTIKRMRREAPEPGPLDAAMLYRLFAELMKPQPLPPNYIEDLRADHEALGIPFDPSQWGRRDLNGPDVVVDIHGQGAVKLERFVPSGLRSISGATVHTR